MSNLPNSVIRLVPPTLRGGYCPDSWTEFARTLVGGTSSQINLDRGHTFYNFGNRPVYPTPEPPQCLYDLMVDLSPNGDSHAQFMEWFSESDQSLDIGVTEISFNATTLEATCMRVSYMPSLQSLVAPNTLDLGEPSILANPDLLTVSAPLATKIYGSQIYIQGNPSLTSVSFPSLQEVPSAYRQRIFEITDNPALTDIDLGSFVPKEYDFFMGAQNGDFRRNALSAATVNHILSRYVANPLWGTGGAGTHVLFLDGGTNAAPTGQGILDKATLIARGGAIVTTN